MSSEIIGEAMLVLEEFRRTDPVQHREVMAMVDEVLAELKNAWG